MDTELNDVWCVYFHAKDPSKKYSDNTTKLMEIKNIKDFWGTFNNIPLPTAMFSEYGLPKKILKRTGEIPGAISVFRSHSYPTWEDKSNVKGFEWSIKIFKDFDKVNNIWINLLVKTVEDNFEHSNILNGVRIVDSTIDYKIMYRIELWFLDKKYKDYFETKIKELFDIPNNMKLLYREHSTLKENTTIVTSYEPDLIQTISS